MDPVVAQRLRKYSKELGKMAGALALVILCSKLIEVAGFPLASNFFGVLGCIAFLVKFR